MNNMSKNKLKFSFNNKKIGTVDFVLLYYISIFVIIFSAQIIGSYTQIFQIIFIILVFIRSYKIKADLYRVFKLNYFLSLFLVLSVPLVLFLTIYKSRFGPVFFLLFFFFSIVFSIDLFLNPKSSLKLSKFIFYFLIFWFLIQGLNKGFHYEDINSYFNKSSRNYVSAIFAFSVLFLYLSLIYNQKKIKLYPSIIVLIISILSYGRSGILTAILIFIVVFTYKYFNKIEMKRIILFLIICCFIFVILVNFYSVLLENTNLQKGIESPRIKMNLDYINNLSVINIITGYDITKIPIIVEFGNNPHNSFIRLHYNVGGVTILFLVTIIIYFIKSTIKFSFDKLFLISLCVIFLIRSFFDIISFIGMYDFIFFYGLLILNNKSKVN